MKRAFLFFFLTALIISGCSNEINETNDNTIDKAVAVLHPLNGSDVHGIIYFNFKDGIIEIVADVTGLTPGNHGFHIHTYGDLRSNTGENTGGHYNPMDELHGGPETEVRHIGDLGNIYAIDDSTAHFKQNRFTFSINGENPILGRAVVIHEDADDFKAQPSGNSGTKVAAGIIGIRNAEIY